MVAIQRKLAAIFAADVHEFSRLMGEDEAGTLRDLRACRGIIDGLIAAHHGRIFGSAGDSVLAEFASAVSAVECAVACQTALAARNLNRHCVLIELNPAYVEIAKRRLGLV